MLRPTTIEVKHNPRLTREYAVAVFRHTLLGKYKVVHANLIFGSQEFFVTQSQKIGVRVKLKQKKDKTLFHLAWVTPGIIRRWLLFIFAFVLERSSPIIEKDQTIMEEVIKVIKECPEFN